MATNREIVTDALRMLGVVRSNQQAGADDAALALREMNDLFSDIEGDGIDLGYSPQDNLSDEFPCEDRISASIKPMLALRLVVHFPSQEIPAELPNRALRSELRIYRVGVLANIEEATMENIPLGSVSVNNSILTDE